MRNDTHPTARTDAGRDTTRGPSAPLGIIAIAILGIVGSLLSALAGVALLGQGSAGVALGVAVVGLAAAQAYVLVELVAMEPWAHSWAVALYALNAVVNAVLLEPVGVVLSALIAAYIWSKRDLYRASGKA